MLDEYCKLVIEKNPNARVAWYLMAAYAYYHEDNPIITDALFDDIANSLYEDWLFVFHQHKHLITVDDLQAGTLLLKKDNYPLMVLGALKNLRKELENGKG